MANVDVYRQIYNVLGVFVSPSPATGYMFGSGISVITATSGVNLLTGIPRVQSVNITAAVNRVDVNQYGQLARLDQLIVSPFDVTVNLDYLLLDGWAEALMGLAASGQQSMVSGLIDGTQSEKNYFLGIAPEGVDLINATTNPNNVNVVGIGNAVISNYSMNLAIGQIPRATVTLQANNQQIYTGSSNNASPAIDPNTSLQVVGPQFSLPTLTGYTGANIVSALRPGDITLSFPRFDGLGDYLSGIGQVHVQGLSLSVPIALDPINQLGNPFPIARKIRFPVDCTLQIDALAADVATGNLANLFCSDAPVNLSFSLHNPNCARTGSNAITVYFNQAKLSNRDFSSSIGQNSTVRLTFVNQLGGITPGYLTQGIVFSGSYGNSFS